MSEGVTSNGLTVKSYNELLAEIQTTMNSIYATDGNEINFDSSTPDGQFTNILTQMGSDIRDFATSIYNSFNPDNCQGAVQDSRYAINFLTRKSGTFTIQNINVTLDRTVTLTGLDGEANNPQAVGGFVVSDGSSDGVWYLLDTVTKTAGTYSLAFRSKNYGVYSPTIGTINTMVTIVPGVTSVNNSVAPTTLGRQQEADSDFKIRRSKSTVRPGQNNIDALYAEIMNLDGVTDCLTWVNNTSTTDSTGTAPYTVWVIVEGGSNADIGSAIYQYSCGLATRGATSVNNYSIAGQLFETKFDRANPVPLYIRFDYQTVNEVDSSYLQTMADKTAENLSYVLNEPAETSKITCAAKEAITSMYGEGYALNVEISTDNTNWVDYIPSASLKDKFVVDGTRITITQIQPGVST